MSAITPRMRLLNRSMDLSDMNGLSSDFLASCNFPQVSSNLSLELDSAAVAANIHNATINPNFPNLRRCLCIASSVNILSGFDPNLK